ncbi:TapB family protein [Arenibacter echinorum]|uniref:DUF3108 domain-containing protein n=1 Tax=Arenibacter echinorum TaxID=440515 RepID=A0A327R223_9FLAO|nr:hypothetical protein [Arenibacter echinorum]RAJ07947.1 hypothetical protein LV92_03509 [Arenibacter echinorum]
MRTLTLVYSFFLVTSTTLSQDCSKYFPMEEGTKFQITNYDKKDKVSGVMDYVVKEFSGNTATLFYEMHDDKGKMILSSEYGVTCTNDGIKVDFSSMMSPELMGQYKDMEVEMTGTDLLYPNNISTGQSLPDADVLMTVKMPPLNMRMNMNFFNRKVIGNESVTTPAGTFDCYVITFDTEAKMGVKMTNSNKLWLAEGYGMVQQETYNKKGDLMSKSVLTSFEK